MKDTFIRIGVRKIALNVIPTLIGLPPLGILDDLFNVDDAATIIDLGDTVNCALDYDDIDSICSLYGLDVYDFDSYESLGGDILESGFDGYDKYDDESDSMSIWNKMEEDEMEYLDESDDHIDDYSSYNSHNIDEYSNQSCYDYDEYYADDDDLDDFDDDGDNLNFKRNYENQIDGLYDSKIEEAKQKYADDFERIRNGKLHPWEDAKQVLKSDQNSIDYWENAKNEAILQAAKDEAFEKHIEAQLNYCDEMKKIRRKHRKF